MFCCIVVSLSELNLFLSAMKRIRVIKINKATAVCKHDHPSHQRGLWGQRGNCAWILHICGRTRSAVGLILRQNSGDYSGAGQNTVALSEIAEVFFCFALRGFQQGFAGQTVKVRYSVQIRKEKVKLF